MCGLEQMPGTCMLLGEWCTSIDTKEIDITG